MTQTVIGSGLGIYNSSIGLGSYGAKGSAALGQGGESVYVNAANGNLILRQADGFLADMGLGFDLFQTYNSRGEGGGSWVFNVQSRLEFHGEANQDGSYVIRVMEDGHRSRFIWDAAIQAYRPEEGGTARLVFQNNNWTYRDGSTPITYQYNAQGQLTTLRDQDGHSLSFHYTNGQLTSISDAGDKQTITWSFANGLLTDVTTSSEGQIIHHLHYEYDEHQRLHQVSRDLGNGKSYWITYEYAGDSNLISDISQADGTKLHIDYDAEGRVKRLIDGEGRITTYTYGQGQTTLTNSLSESWTYFYDAQNRLTGIDGPEQYRIRYYYEGMQLSQITQGNQVWRYRYNEAGDCIYAEEPNGQITQRRYDAEHHLLAETKYQSFDGEHHPTHPKTTRYTYDERGHLRFAIAADGTVTEYRYTAEGQLMSSRCYLQAGYTQEQELLSEATMAQWASQQNPQQVSLVDYRYDWRGQLSEEIQYRAVDAQGVGIDQGQASHTRTIYDAAGRLREKSILTAEGWSTTQYFYDDLGRLIQTLDNHHNSQRIEYDDMHQRIIQTDANGLQTCKLYDHSGLLLATQRLDAHHNYGSTQYHYDAAGRLIAETGVDGLSRYFFYDAQGRVLAKVNAQGQMTEYRYNEDGLLIQTHQYAQRISTQSWLSDWPTFASITPQFSSKDAISQTIYNEYNQVAYTINAQGAVIAYTYDAEGHVLSKTAYAMRLANYHPEALLSFSAIKLQTDVKDRQICYYYDVAGRVHAEINAEGYAIEYRYNHLGQVIETIRYVNKVSAVLSGAWAQDKPAAKASDIHTYSLYDAQGLKIADIDGEGYLIEYRYDVRGLLHERIAYEHKITTVINEQMTLEFIRPKAGTNDHKTSYDYTDLGQLRQERTQSGLITTYAYDEMGQLILKSRQDEHTHALRQQRLRYDALGRVIQELDELGGAKLNAANLTSEQIEALWQQHSIHYSYEMNGLLASKTDALHRTTRYFYNEHQQLQYTVSANGAVMETQYNALNQVELVRKYSAFLKNDLAILTTQDISARMAFLKDSNFDETTRYEYNSIGQVIAKYTGSKGLVTSEYNAFGELTFSTQTIDASRHQVTSYDYDRRGLLTDQVDDVGGLNRHTSFKYDAFGWMTTHIDGRQVGINYTLNKRGEQIRIFNASNQFKKITYDAFGRVLSETDYTHNKFIKVYAYDDVNNLLILTNPLVGTEIKTQFNAFGDKIAFTDANKNKTEFHYDERGLLIRVDSPENSFKEYHYDDAGQLLWQEDAGGHKIAYTYDAQGHVLTKTVDPDGLNIITSYQYDAIGRQLQVTEAKRIKEFTYDDAGRLIKSCIDSKSLNLVTEFTYDARGLLVRQTELNSQGSNKVIAYEWDSLGRRSTTIIDPDGLRLTTRYQYDANDNLICQTDANQHSTHYIYDVNNQCRYQINARGVVTEHTYDENGNELQTVTYANCITSLSVYTEESLKNVLLKDNQHDQYQFRAFDGAGRLLCTYDSLGYATKYGYDGNGNVLKIRHFSQAIALDVLKSGKRPWPEEDNSRYDYFAYDGLNQLRYQCDTKGCVTESRYDTSGQLVARTQYAHPLDMEKGSNYTLVYFQENLAQDNVKDKTTRYAYDQAGRLRLEISPQGVAKSYQYNALNQVISCTRYAVLANANVLASMSLSDLHASAQDRINTFVYDAAGREVYRISAEGQVVERRYDDVGNVRAQITHQQRVRLAIYGLDELHQQLEYDQGARSTTYDYDATGRLLSETNAARYITRYQYDANGNVINKTQANQAVWTYSYDEANQLIQTTSPVLSVMTGKTRQERAVITQTLYDSFGNVVQEIRDATGIKQIRFYTYDAMNRRIKTTYPDVNINNASHAASNQRQEYTQTLSEELRYNSFGEVIASSDKAGNWSHFAYDSQGNLCYSVDTRGGLTQCDYDAFGRLTAKTRYNTPVTLAKDSTYSINEIEQAHRGSTYDRHEWFDYDLDDQLIESRRDAVRTYNAKTKEYSMQAPTTRKVYNAFGDVLQVMTRLNEEDNAAYWPTTTFYYDKEGHQTAMIDAEGYLTTYTLNAFGETQSMTEYASRSESHDAFNYRGPQAHAKDRTVTFTYDALGQVTSKTLKQVRVSRIVNQRLETQIRDLTTSYSYDGLGHLTETVDAQGNSAYCYYDAVGQLIAKVAPQTQDGRAATTYSYDALGNLVETHQWANGARGADKEGYQVNEASARDIVTSSQFDAQDLLLSETDGMQHTVFYSYDAKGNLARSFRTLTNADKSHVIQDRRYAYDSEGHLLQTTTFKNNGTKTEEARYNIFGEISAKGINGQYNVHVDYDLLGRVWRSNTQGYYQIFVYDLADQVTQIVTSANGFHPEGYEQGMDLSGQQFETKLRFSEGEFKTRLQRQDNVYDAMGHLLSQSKEYTLRIPDNENKGRLSNPGQYQSVDRWGNMTSYTNALGKQTLYEYNAFNEVERQELPEVSYMDEQGQRQRIKPTNRYAYDELGRVIAMIDANEQMATKAYDAVGHLISETDAKTKTRSKHYNLLNQLDYSINELHGKTSYTYDAANRLVKVVTPRTHQDYIYDEAGQLIQQINGMGETTTFSYDSLGNQISRQDARGYHTDYEYDDAGHKTKETNALGKQQTWVYDEDGRLIRHTDLGNHATAYEYNTNGLLLHEYSSTGKSIRYYYQGDGQLIQYADEGRGEIVDYTYDTEGQMLSKISSRAGGVNDGWIREIDYYQYDDLGRLTQVRRRNPEDTDNRFPEDDKSLLSVDYDYDKVGNIRHTKVSARYRSHAASVSEDYYTYDENNRMTINKGQLVNGTIVVTANQGSVLAYDGAGNITDAEKYEGGVLQKYYYGYNNDNQLESIQKNGAKLQFKSYDDAGRVTLESSFNDRNEVAQRNRMIYVNGVLEKQITYEGEGYHVVSTSSYQYDDIGNTTSWSMELKGGKGQIDGSNITHTYTYELWDSYQQQGDAVTIEAYNSTSTHGSSTRRYNQNDGLLEESIDAYVDDNNRSNNISYLSSSLEGTRARTDKDGRTGYLTVAGKTIGDLRLDNSGTQHLTIYGGFTPSGSQFQWKPSMGELQSRAANQQQIAEQFQRQPGDVADGTLPEVPQDTLGTYTLQAGDTLESIALQVYGDSSLWYLIADANGIADRKAMAGHEGQLHIGQRLTIPPAATGQHHTSGTHKVLNANQMIGDTSAKAAMPTPLPVYSKPKHHSIWSKIIVAVVAVVATVLTAGAIGIAAGVAGSIFSAGTAVLGGALASTTGSIAAGFAAGFVGSIASQGAATALGMQQGVDVTGALISGLATAATAGVGHSLKSVTAFQNMTNTLNQHSLEQFSVATAAEMLEQNAASQAVNVAFRKHQHFDWTELGVSGITGGVLGGNFGDKVNKTLGKLDHNTGILRSEFQALAGAGAQSVTTGGQFNATQVLGDSLGSVLGNALVNAGQSPVPTNAMAALSLEDDLNDMHAAFNNFVASQLSGHDGYNESQPNQSYEYSSIPVAENYSTIPEQENYSSIPKSEFYEYSAIPNPDAATARSNGVMHMSVSNASLESHLAGLGLLLESSSSTCKSIPMDNAFLIEKSEIKLNKIKHFDLDDARNGLRQVYDQYGAEMSKVVEKMYRYETKHFTSAQYVLTGTAGMEASHGSKAPYYGWSSDFFKEYPEYTPIGTTGLHDGIGISKQGGNKQKKGITQYIQFPSVEAGMLHLAYKIKNTYHGNFARWHSTTPSHQQSYKDGLKYVRCDITKNLIKES